MARRTETYNTPEERQALVAVAKAAGEVMLHDEVIGGQPTLTFGTPDELPPPIPVEQPDPRLVELRGKVRAQTASLPEVVEYLKMRDNL